MGHLFWLKTSRWLVFSPISPRAMAASVSMIGVS